MPFMLVDDLLNSHAKARRAGLEAMGLWVMAGSLVAQQLSDGAVPEWFVRSWPDGDVLAKRLVDAELWHSAGHDCSKCPQPGDNEWMFHEWTKINPTRERVLEKRAARKAAGQRGGIASAQAFRAANAEPTTEPLATANGRADRTHNRSAVRQTPSPSPRSTSVVTLVSLLTSAGATGVTTTTIQNWAQRHTPGIDIETETAAFLTKNAGQTLHDPRAAWQAWMRKARPDQPAVPARPTTSGLPPPADAPRCPVDGHEHELAGNCRICAADALESSPDVLRDQEVTS